MFDIYCNHCYQGNKDNSTVEFYLSSCGHIFCKECCKSACNICKRPYNPILICKNMPPELAILFEDNEKLYRDFQRVTKFQLIQKAYFAHHHINILPTLKKKAMKEHHGLVRLNSRINEMLEEENQRIKKLKEYLAYHERRLEQATYKGYSTGERPPIVPRRRSSLTSTKIVSSQPRGPSTPPLSSNETEGSSRALSEPSLRGPRDNNNDFQF